MASALDKLREHTAALEAVVKAAQEIERVLERVRAELVPLADNLREVWRLRFGRRARPSGRLRLSAAFLSTQRDTIQEVMEFHEATSTRSREGGGVENPKSPKPQRQGCALERAFGLVLLAGVLLALQAEPTRTWRGLVVAPEYRCSAYTARAYCYPQSVELRIVAAMGARILTAETEEDFAQALDMQGPDDELEAPAEVMEAFGIQSDESLGIKAEAS